MKKKFCFFFASITFIIFLAIISGCSLDYESSSQEKIRAPEFTFENLALTKIEKGKKKAEIQADVLEQYHKLDASFGKNVTFKLFNDENLIEVEGSTDLLSVDNKTEIYTMFDYASVTSYDQNINIQAKNLKWNNKTEQLTSSAEDIVTISNLTEEPKSGYVKSNSENKTQMVLQGKGFSASGVTWQYAFRNATTGKFITEEKGSTGENSDENLQ